MKRSLFLTALVALTSLLSGCSSAYYASAGYAGDDLYAVHDRTQIARRQQAKAEAEKAAAEARKAEWEARIAEAQAAAAENRYYEYNSNPYQAVLADTYESAYARRLRGFESPTYNMPSSYVNARYGTAFNYVSAYDPAFYNVIVMGDQVWVEPKYITSMFGTWGRPVYYVDPWYYGWRDPWWSWGPSFSIGSWGWSFGWNSWHNPWWGPSWSWGWGPGWHGHHHWGPGWAPGWGPGHGHGPGWRPSNIVHRPDPFTSPSGRRYGATSGSRYGSSYGQSGAPSTLRGTGNRNSGSFGVRNSPSGGSRYQGGASRSDGRNNRTGTSGSSYRDTGGNTYNRGGSSYDSGSSRGSSYNSGSSSRGGSFGGSSGGGSGTRSSGGSYRNSGGR